MKFSYDWLQTWITPNLTATEMANLLTMSGLEVEEIELAAPLFSGVFIAEIKSVEKHPNADKLNITQVDADTGELIQIVCGAPNVKVGIKIPCALPDAILPGNFKIKPTKMRGEISNGMLCSAKELGLTEYVDGLYLLPNDAPIGVNIRDYLKLDDSLLTLKITPNRTDCLSIKGIAREVKALTKSSINNITIQSLPASHPNKYEVKNLVPDDCGRFVTRIIKKININVDTPLWMKQRLERSGLRSINILVDIGNYVMLELGQPMHIFDLDKLNGPISIRRAQNGEKLHCLNDKEVTLSDNTLVIADEAGVLSIAGLMGGVASAVSDQTQNILLESAFFHPKIIAGKSRQYGFSSDSSFRFERGVDYQLQQDAIERATALITEYCGGQIHAISEVLGKLPQSKIVKVRHGRIQKILGIQLDKQETAQILRNLSLEPMVAENSFIVNSPSFRFDIEQEIDLIEEIARIHGYNNIPDDSPCGSLTILSQPETKKNRRAIYQLMANRNYQEIISYAFVDEQWEKDFADNHQPIRLKNPIASQMSVMRSTLIGGLIDTLQKNLNRKQTRIRLFEIAKTFKQNPNQSYIQEEYLAALAFGSRHPEQWGEPQQKIDFYDVKKDVEILLQGQKIQFTSATHPALHPGRCAHILKDNQIIGFIGELHPNWVHQYDLPYAPILFELNLNAILEQRKITYQAVSKFQPIRRDLAFIVAEDVQTHELFTALKTVNDGIIESMDIFDVYRGQGLAKNTKSLAFKFIFRSHERTLLDEEIENIVQKLIQAAQSVGAQLRT